MREGGEETDDENGVDSDDCNDDGDYGVSVKWPKPHFSETRRARLATPSRVLCESFVSPL